MSWFSKRSNLYLILAALAILFLAVHVIVAIRPTRSLMAWFHIDDAYYYFQVARNVAEGRGFTFDGIGKSNGFHPLWMLINIPVFALARINPYLPFRILVMVSATITLLGDVVLFDLLRRHLRVEIALLGSAIWLFYWPLHGILTQTGMEAGIYAFSMLFFLWCIRRLDRLRAFHFILLGMAASLVLFSRMDSIFFILLAGAWLILHISPLRELALVDILTVFITVFTSIILRTGAYESLPFLKSTQFFLVVSFIVKLVLYYLCGLYQWPSCYSLKTLFLRLAAASLLSSTVVSLIMLVLIKFGFVVHFPRSALLIEGGMSFGLLLASRLILRFTRSEASPADISLRTHIRLWSGRAILYFLPITLLLGGYFLWNLQTFGTPMPISGQIKQWWGTLLTTYGRHQENIWTIFRIIPLSQQDQQPWFLINRYLFNPFYRLFKADAFAQTTRFLILKFTLITIYTVSAWLLLSKKRRGIKDTLNAIGFVPLLVASLIQPLYYAFTGYLAMREWYWVPQIILTILSFLILLDVGIDRVKKPEIIQQGLHYLPLVLVLCFAIQFPIKISQRFPIIPNEANTSDYLKITRYLEANTPDGALIGMPGGGTEAYFIKDRTIINLDGLINSKAYYDLMRAGKANQYFDDIGLDYVLGNAYVLLESDPYHWFFDDRLGPQDQFEDLTLFLYLKGR